MAARMESPPPPAQAGRPSVKRRRWRAAAGAQESWPAVYVDHVDALGSIAVARSLGRAGYQVHAASEDARSLGLRSRYVAYAAVHPPLESAEFLGWFRHYLAEHRIAAVIPSERLALRLAGQAEDLLPLIPFATSPEQLRRTFGKYDLFQTSLAAGLTEHLPALRLIDFERQEESAHGELRFPVYIKVDAVHARQPGQKSEVVRVADAAELEGVLRALSARFQRVVIQSYVPGQGVAASFLLWGGEPQAEFLHRRLHEVPYTGGVSSWRQEFQHTGLRADALARVKALGLEQGPVMVEYRLDETSGEFWLMELNARFWGSLHLPYYAGVDFPVLLIRRFLVARNIRLPAGAGKAVKRRRQISCRHLPAEVQHCWTKLKSRELSPGAKFASIGVFFALMLDPRVKSDLGSFPGDRQLLLVAVSRFLQAALPGLLKRARQRIVLPFIVAR